MNRSRLTSRLPPTALPLPYLLPRHTKQSEMKLRKWLEGEDFYSEGSVSLKPRPPENGPPLTQDSDACRKVVAEEVLPLFLKLAKAPGGKLRDPQAQETLAGIQKQLASLHIKLVLSSRGAVQPVTDGRNALVAWAILVLDGVRERGDLVKFFQCECGCGVWVFKANSKRRFAPGCRTKFHQSSPEFKKSHNEKAKETRRLHREGKVKEITRRPTQASLKNAKSSMRKKAWDVVRKPVRTINPK
jgi:hypothetical protein